MTSYLRDSLRKARYNASRGELAGRILAHNKAAGIGNLSAQLAGQGIGGSLGALLKGGRETTHKNYYLLRDWVYTCSALIARRVSAQHFAAGTIENPTHKFANYYATKDYLDNALGEKERYERRKAFLARLNEQLELARIAVPKHAPMFIKELAANGHVVEKLPGHEALNFLQQPNPIQGKEEFLTCSVFNLLLTGEFYWIGGNFGDSPNDKTGSMQIWCVPSAWIEPEHKGHLFSGYRLKLPGTPGEGPLLPPEIVCRVYYPDPADFKKALAPVIAMLRAVRTDEFIQHSQAQSFEQGIFPNIVIEMGERTGPNGENLGRPTLTGPQRRQIIKAIREVWNAQTSNRDPAIVDGLIGGIHKLQAMPAEMDWLQSGETVKKRIFQAFGLNPIVVGEITGANRAQAAVADQSATDNVINPMVNKISVALQKFVVPMFDTDNNPDAGLALWLEEAKPKDEELDLRKIAQARAGGSASRNEERNVLGLPPVQSDAGDLIGLGATAAGAQAVQALLTQVTMGTIQRESALVMLTDIYGFSKQQATKLLGKEDYQPPGLLGGPPGSGPGGTSGDGDAGRPLGMPKPKPSNKPDNPDDSTGNGNKPPLDSAGADKPGKETSLITLKGATLPKLTRGVVKAHNARLRGKLEREAAVAAIPFFERSSREQLSDLLAEATLCSTLTTRHPKPSA